MRRTVNILILSFLLPQLAAAQSYLLLVSGIGGEPEYSDTFYQRSVAMLDAAQQRLGLPKSHITYLAERPDRDPERIDGRSTKEQIESAIAALASRVKPGDSVFILLIGHGNARDGTAFFNIPGPDISAAEFALLLEQLADQQVVFVNTAPSSAPFVPALSGPDRVVITATASESERYYAVFGDYFVAAFAAQGADTDKDGRVSILEAFDYARREAQRMYASENRLQTEHALLDDNGDGEGSLEPDLEEADGALARTLFFEGAETVAAAAPAISADPELAVLAQDKQDLVRQIEALKKQKDELDPETYDIQLEDLLVELALKSREMRAREEK